MRRLLAVALLIPALVFAQWAENTSARLGILALQVELLGQGRVLLVGDSQTQFFWWSTVGGCNVLNAGMGGATSADVAAAAPGMAAIVRPALVHLMIGTNDMLGGVDPKVTALNVAAIVRAFAPTPVVLWPIPVGGVTNAALSTTPGVYWDWWWPTQVSLGPDGVHLSATSQVTRDYRIVQWQEYLGVPC